MYTPWTTAFTIDSLNGDQIERLHSSVQNNRTEMLKHTNFILFIETKNLSTEHHQNDSCYFCLNVFLQIWLIFTIVQNSIN